jgi:c-di-GMP-binding flagellar brake protein YcgR
MFIDRRKHTREAVAQTCSVECASEGWSCSGEIKDISDGGMGLEMMKAPKVRDEMTLYMMDQGERPSVKKGMVAWVKEKTSLEVNAMVGLQFA